MGRCASLRVRCGRHCVGCFSGTGSKVPGTPGCKACRSCGGRAIRAGCTKSYLVVLNFMFLIGGSAVLGLGFWMRIERQTFVYMDLLHTVPSSGPLVLFEKLPSVFIVIGGSVAVLSFLGCCGACADSACFLCLYVLLLCLILITEIIVTAVIMVFREKMLLKLEVSLQHQIRFEYNKTGRYSNTSSIDTDHVTFVLDTMQIKLNCCGATGPLDYRDSAWFNRTKHISSLDYYPFVPKSCCLPASVDAPENRCQIQAILPELERTQPLFLKTQGCQRSIVNWFRSNTILVVGIVCIIVVLQILDLVSACMLMAWVRHKHSDCGSTADDSEFG